MNIKPKDIILQMQVPSRPGLYVLGVFETRVTVYSQQVRALNLIYALCQEQWIGDSTKVAVIGAGVAGLTAAVAAACRGATVTIFEQLTEPLALIGRSSKRWLHPHIYEWPKTSPDLPDPLDPDARLPLLTWQAGTVAQVRDRLIEQYNQAAGAFAINLRPQATNLTIVPGSSQHFSLSWNQPGGYRTRQYDIVILAVGFGLERQAAEIPFLSYWSNDKLDEEDARIHGRRKRILVSGTGDGGLIDLARVRIKDFAHDKIASRLTTELLDQETLAWLTDRLLTIEAEAERALSRQKPYTAKLNEDYQDLAEQLTRRVDLLSQLKIRPDTQAVLTSQGDHPLTLRTSILNRLLYSLLPDVRYFKGPWTSQRNPDGTIKVTFSNGKSEDFDDIIVRHGAAAALERDFPDIWKQCETLQQSSVFDQTRFPIYGDFFDGCSSRIVGEPTREAGPMVVAEKPTPMPSPQPAPDRSFGGAIAGGSQEQKPDHQPSQPTRADVYAKLAQMTEDEFYTFCLLHFEEVSRSLTAGMAQLARLNYLFDYCWRKPDQWAKLHRLLFPENT